MKRHFFKKQEIANGTRYAWCVVRRTFSCQYLEVSKLLRTFVVVNLRQ